MTNALSKITAALLAVILVCVYPAFQSAQRQEDIRVLTAYNTTTRFVDSVRSKGYISPVMYEQFVAELGLDGSDYKIELEHRQKKYIPEYDDPADVTTFLGYYSIHDEAYYEQDILKVLFLDADRSPSSSHFMEGMARNYLMETGDFFTVKLTQLNKTPIDTFQQILFPGLTTGRKQAIIYGGMILNEDY